MDDNSLNGLHQLLREAISLPKCRKCGCMKDALDAVSMALPQMPTTGSRILQDDVRLWQEQMEPIKYSCLGCPYCYGAEISNLLNFDKPDTAAKSLDVCCSAKSEDASWPPEPGEYHVVCEGGDCPVAVSTLSSIALADELARLKPDGLCIVGKTETENIGIDKVVKNCIANPSIRFLLLVGQESQGHFTGQTILSLFQNGIDDDKRVISAKGKRPVLKNVSTQNIDTLRQRVQVIDMIGSEDINIICQRIRSLSEQSPPETKPCECGNCQTDKKDSKPSLAIIPATEPVSIALDKVGYFVIIVRSETKEIIVEHYSNDNILLHVTQGKTARSLYHTIISSDWLSQLSHAAYLGKELARAEMSLMQGIKYIQDGA